MRVPVEPTHCCHGRLHAQHIVVMVVAAARAARLRIACGVVFMPAADPVGSRGRIGEKPSSPATSPAVAAAPCFGRVPLPSRPRRGRCTSSTGERGGACQRNGARCQRADRLCVEGLWAASSDVRPPSSCPYRLHRGARVHTKKKKRTPPAYNPATRPHPAAHTRHTTKRTSNHHPTPTSDTSHPASVHPCAHSRGSAVRHHPAVPPAARQRTCTTALAAGVSNDRGSHRLPHQPGPSQQPTSRILVPTARFRRPTDSNTAVRPHDAPSARPLFTRFRPPANPGHRAPPTPRPPRVQGGHTLTAGRRRRPLI